MFYGVVFMKRSIFLTKSLERFIKWEPAKGGGYERATTLTYLVTLMIAVSAIYMTANHVAQWFFFNADALWMEDYLQDWFVHDVNMKSWMTPGAPNFFPEMLIYGLIRFVTGSVYWGFVGFGLIKITLYATIFYSLLSWVTGLSRTHKLWFSSLFVSVLLLTSIFLGQQFFYPRMPDFWQLFVPTAHGGAITNAIVAIFLTLLWFRDPGKSGLWITLLFILSILASLSDRMYVVWFMGPALGAALALLMLGFIKWRTAIGMGGVLLLSDFIARKIFVWIVPFQQVPYQFSKEGWKTTLHFYTDLIAEGWYHPVVLFSYFCLVGVTVWVLFQEWKTQGQRVSVRTFNPKEAAKYFLLPYAALVLPISFLAMALMNRPETQYFTWGNLLAFYFWVFLLAISSTRFRLYAKGWFHVAVISSLLGYVVICAVSRPNQLTAMLIPANPYSKLVSCLDSHSGDLGQGGGVADYWQARKINLFSQKGLRVDQAQGEFLRIFQWASNREMFDVQKHTFVLTNTPTNLSSILEEDVIRMNGKPDIKFVCDGFPVLVYGNGLKTTVPVNEGLQNLLKKKLAELAIGPGDLFTDVGQWRQGALFSTGKEGWLQFGPYATLAAGSYRVEWRGEIIAAGLEEVGTADVATSKGVTVLGRAPITLKSLAEMPKGQLAAMEFSVDHNAEFTEFRLFIKEKVMVRLDEVVIKLIK